jgi:precorrin-3B synthase
METGDGLLLRLRLPGGTISLIGLRALADVAEQFGNGVIELSARANAQVRGLAPEHVETAAELLGRAGLVNADAGRNVVGGPLSGHDPHALIDLSPLVHQASDLFIPRTQLQGLPPKFAVVLDDGGTASTRHLSADMCVGAVVSDTGEVMMQIELGRTLADSDAHVLLVAPADVIRVLLAGAELCANNEMRMSASVEQLGRANVATTLTNGVDVHWQHHASNPRPHSAPLGVLEHCTPGFVNVGAAPPLGRCTPIMLRALATICESTSSLVRFTPWRGVVVLGVEQARLDEVIDGLEQAGFSSDPANRAHLISACVGAPGCRSGLGDTVGVARDLLRSSTPLTTTIHFSGCEKRCGADAEQVLVADERGLFQRESSAC